MSMQIKEESLASLAGYYSSPEKNLNWPSLFSLPAWMQTWWDSFGENYHLLLLSIWQNGELTGLAPLMRREKEAFLVGSPDICDYLDFVIVPGREEQFFKALLPALQEYGLDKLTLYAQRPDAAFFGLFNSPCIAGSGWQARFSRVDESYELFLAPSWEEYLSGLNKKQRHEIRRKIRRLENEAGHSSYRVIEEAGAIKRFLPHFFDLFRQNPDKAGFFTAEMEQFFRAMIDVMADSGLIRFGLLEIENITAAAVLYFDYRQHIYLYNSGYLSDYGDLSVGLLSKVFSIRKSLEKGSLVYDFLKGSEVYKSRLGGLSIPIYTTTLSVKR